MYRPTFLPNGFQRKMAYVPTWFWKMVYVPTWFSEENGLCTDWNSDGKNGLCTDLVFRGKCTMYWLGFQRKMYYVPTLLLNFNCTNFGFGWIMSIVPALVLKNVNCTSFWSRNSDVNCTSFSFKWSMYQLLITKFWCPMYQLLVLNGLCTNFDFW